jgi:hypothetical protein
MARPSTGPIRRQDGIVATAAAPPHPRYGRRCDNCSARHIEWKDGQNWGILTAYCAESDEVTTVEVTLTQWFALVPVRYAVEERLERWQENKFWSQRK